MDPAEAVQNVLTHFGVKGMRWGIRKESSAQKTLRTGSTKRDFKDARKDESWRLKRHGGKIRPWGFAGSKITNAITKDAHKNMKPEIKMLNKKPEFTTKEAKKAIRKAKHSYHPDDPIAAKYHKEVSEIYMKHVRAAAPRHMKVSPSGKWQEEFFEGKNYWNVGLKKVDGAKHASISDPDIVIRVRPIKDEDGYIIDFELVDDSMAQAEEVVSDILAHVGVKGMRWGIRRKATVGPEEVIVRDSRVTGKGLRSTGGRGHPATKQAVDVRTIGQIAKKSGVKALTDDQLNQYAKRIQLEENVKRLQYTQKSPAQKFVAKLLGQTGKTTAQNAANDVAGQQVKKRLIKAGILAAA